MHIYIQLIYIYTVYIYIHIYGLYISIYFLKIQLIFFYLKDIIYNNINNSNPLNGCMKLLCIIICFQNQII